MSASQPRSDAGRTPSGAGSSPRDGGQQDLPFRTLGHYEIVARIGRGKMGDVYKGYERALDRYVAIKVLPTTLARDEAAVRRFRREASAAARVIHPNVVPIHFIGQERDGHFFVMQYVEGETLAELLARRGGLSVEESISLLEQMLSGLAAAHRQGLIHRDVKPANVLLDSLHHRAMLADFGLARTFREGERWTTTGRIPGTAEYIAPEQGRGLGCDVRSDLYSVGVIAWQMLAGRLPFEAPGPAEMLYQHACVLPTVLSEEAPEVPGSLAALVGRLMAKSPADRYATADEVLTDLQAVRERRPLPSCADMLDARERARLHGSPPAGKPSGGDAPGPTSVIAEAHDLDASPPELHFGWWLRVRSRLARLMRVHAPGLLERLQNTQQQMDGAVAEYEQRRDRLAALVAEAGILLHELSQQEPLPGEDSTADPGVREDRARAMAQQAEELEELRVRRDRADAVLQRLRNQRDLLNARLRVAEARSGRDRPAKRYAAVALLSLGAVVVVVIGMAATRQILGHSSEKEEPEAAPEPKTVEVPAYPLPTSTEAATRFSTTADGREVVGLAFVANRSQVVAARSDGTVEVWDHQSGQRRKSLATGAGGADRPILAHRGQFVATRDATVSGMRIWNLDSETDSSRPAPLRSEHGPRAIVQADTGIVLLAAG